MEKEFETALEELQGIKVTDQKSAEHYNSVFKRMVTASMQICSSTDYDSLVQEKTAAAEKKYGVKVEFSEEATDAYKKLRELVRFEMYREALLNNQEREVCCTESNFAKATAMIRGELDAIVPENQKEVLDSMCYSLYSDFTKYFVCATFDMIADAKIYGMKEFRPLQLNALGKEVRTNVNVIHQHNGKPQKSQTVSNWFRTVMILPGILFRKLYGVSMVEMFEVSQKLADDAAHMYNVFEKSYQSFCAGDEYEILKDFLWELGLNECFTVRPKTTAPADKAGKPVMN